MHDKPKRISLVEGSIMAGFVFAFFDAPQYLFDVTGLGPFVNWFFALFGWLSIYIWLAVKGYTFFGKNALWKKAGLWGILDFIPLVPGMSGFVIAFIMKERVKRLNK